MSDTDVPVTYRRAWMETLLLFWATILALGAVLLIIAKLMEVGVL